MGRVQAFSFVAFKVQVYECVCVCPSDLFWIYFGVSPTKARRVLHFAVYQGTTLRSVLFCPSGPTGVAQEGVNTGHALHGYVRCFKVL